MEFKAGDQEPIPKVGDRFLIKGNKEDEKGYFVVKPCDCDCVSVRVRWPSPFWKDNCGPHFVSERNGVVRVLFTKRFSNGFVGWHYDGELIESGYAVAENSVSKGQSCPHSCTKKVHLGIGGNCEMIEVCCDCGEEI
jgi:hypothetical protein